MHNENLLVTKLLIYKVKDSGKRYGKSVLWVGCYPFCPRYSPESLEVEL